MVIQVVEQILQCIAQENQKADDALETLMDDQPQKEPQTGDQNPGFPAPEEPAPSPTRLEWKVTPVIYRRIQESADHMDR